jgi:hypothetical protein
MLSSQKLPKKSNIDIEVEGFSEWMRQLQVAILNELEKLQQQNNLLNV